MMVFAKRNLKLFFRDKSAVFFSLLAVFIIIAIYALFLGDNLINSNLAFAEPKALIHCWLAGGLLAVTSITSANGAFDTMINDKTLKIEKDFYASPVKRSTITLGYIASSFLVAVIMCIVTLVLCQLYILSGNGRMISTFNYVKLFFIILLTAASNTAMMALFVSFFKSHSAFSAASSILNTLAGFLTGVYLPIGSLPASVQLLIKLFPPTHGAALFRQTLMEAQMERSLAGVPAELAEGFQDYMGITMKFGTAGFSPVIHIIILAGSTCVFGALAALNRRRMK